LSDAKAGSGGLPVGFDDVVAAAERIRGVAHRTPVVTSRTLNDRVGATCFFKCESFQRAGAFKFRGAYNAISRLDEEARARGVIAYSSGNHAQAAALAGSLLDAPVTVVMPEDAPRAKRAATEGYGATVVTYDPATEKREEVARVMLEERGASLIPPFDHPHIIAGQGTSAKELLDDVGELDVLLAPCGGGGLLSGSALSARAMSPGCRVIGIEPALADDATRSFRSGEIVTIHNPRTIADGARTASLGQLTFPIIRACVDDMVTVDEDEIVRAMRLLWERAKLVIEPTGALALAGALSGRIQLRGLRIGLILSGGNVDVVEAGRLFDSLRSTR